MTQTLEQIKERFNAADRMNCRDITDLLEYIDNLENKTAPSSNPDYIEYWLTEVSKLGTVRQNGVFWASRLHNAYKLGVKNTETKN